MRWNKADIVVLHRVVCCYPDYEKLLGAAAGHARRMLVFSHPPRNVVPPSVMAMVNGLRLQGNSFREFVHPPSAMVDVVKAQGLTLEYRHGGFAWDVVGFAR